MKFRYYILYVFAIVSLAGCKQDFKVTADYEETPVVYGLLNWQETRHFIRIQKGFLIEGNAYVAAGVPDSIYYRDILTVQLKDANGGATFDLKRVNGDTLNPPLPKDSGAFAKSPNILYTFDGNLDPSRTYRLEIKNNESGKEIFATTTMVKDFSVFLPLRGTKLNLISINSPAIRWNLAENGSLYDFTVRVYYVEHKLSDNNYSKDTFIDIPFLRLQPQEYTPGGYYESRFNSDIVLRYIASRLPANNDLFREYDKAKGMQFIYAVGGTELGKYISSRNAQGGITSNEALPPYTNVDGGVGLLSSRYFKTVDSVFLSDAGIDSLACQEVMKPLRFKNHYGNFCN
ncbi:MAG: DUF4249 family protein [Bacteroidetes bacterium]|nr:DUF4249 family protein [Bacteroidota bacterium]